jgi:hypothetical protein
MKTLLILLLALITAFASAAPMRRPYRKTLKPAPVETHHPVSWKTVAAGGAAVATTVAAYKISDGVEDGLKISAERAPTSFLGAFTLSGYILPVTLIGGLIVIGFIVAHNH